MLIFSDFANTITETQMAVTTIIIIIYLITIELISTNKDENETGKIFNTTIFILVIIFAFMVLKKVMAILK